MAQKLSGDQIRPTLQLEKKRYLGVRKIWKFFLSGAIRSYKKKNKNKFFTKSKFSTYFEDVYGIGFLAVISPL